jgi:CDP-diacylglycerol--serine O-phosphatidyltransferase
MGASVVVFSVFVTHNAGQFQVVSETLVAAVVVVLSYLMVSRVRFRSFKDVRFSRKSVGAVLLVAGVWAALRMNRIKDTFIFLLLIAAYIGLGLTEEIISLQRRLREARAGRDRAAATEDQPEDEAVLEELGAFDPEPEAAPPAKAAPASPPSPPSDGSRPAPGETSANTDNGTPRSPSPPPPTKPTAAG